MFTTRHALGALILSVSATTLSSQLIAGQTLYVATGSGNEVVAIDIDSRNVSRRFTDVINPHGLTMSKDGEYLFAGSLTPEKKPADPKFAGKLFLVHPAHGHVMSTIPVTDWSHHQDISPDGRYIVSTHPAKGGVSIVDTLQQRQVAFIATGPAPNYGMFDTAGDYLYVTNTGNGTVSQIAVSDWKKQRDLPAGMAPGHMTAAVDGSRLFVSNPGVGTISMIDIAQGKISKTFTFAPGLHGLAVSDDGKYLYATSKTKHMLFRAAIDGDEIKQQPLKPAPYHMEAIRGTGLLYISSANTPTVWLIDQVSLNETGKLDLGNGEGHQAVVGVE